LWVEFLKGGPPLYSGLRELGAGGTPRWAARRERYRESTGEAAYARRTRAPRARRSTATRSALGIGDHRRQHLSARKLIGAWRAGRRSAGLAAPLYAAGAPHPLPRAPARSCRRAARGQARRHRASPAVEKVLSERMKSANQGVRSRSPPSPARPRRCAQSCTRAATGCPSGAPERSRMKAQHWRRCCSARAAAQRTARPRVALRAYRCRSRAATGLDSRF
jgi:hypothetical protein